MKQLVAMKEFYIEMKEKQKQGKKWNETKEN